MEEEVFFSKDKFIISKTDNKGKITYGNELFIEISGYNSDELINKPHSILRHPDMPKIIFKRLWDSIQNSKEIFAYVKNRTKQGKYYWVLAFVTPTLDTNGNLLEYFSVRRVPEKSVIKDIIEPLYTKLLSLEKQGGMAASEKYLNNLLKEKDLDYEQFIFSL